MSNSVDSDETAHNEPSHHDLCCLQKPIIITCGSERVNSYKSDHVYLKKKKKKIINFRNPRTENTSAIPAQWMY